MPYNNNSFYTNVFSKHAQINSLISKKKIFVLKINIFIFITNNSVFKSTILITPQIKYQLSTKNFQTIQSQQFIFFIIIFQNSRILYTLIINNLILLYSVLYPIHNQTHLNWQFSISSFAIIYVIYLFYFLLINF